MDCTLYVLTEDGATPAGVFTFDGVGAVAAAPMTGYETLFQSVAADPCTVDERPVLLSDQPEAWFKALPSTYCGTYLWATIQDAAEKLAKAGYEDVPRDEKGRWEGTGELRAETRAERSKRVFKPSTAEKQCEADRSEEQLAKGLGIARTGDNRPFDLVQGKVAVEVKTLLDGAHGKLTMHPESLARKVAFAEKYRLRTYTVAVDKREDVNKPVYYARKGLGSFRIEKMTRLASFKALKVFIR